MPRVDAHASITINRIDEREKQIKKYEKIFCRFGIIEILCGCISIICDVCRLASYNPSIGFGSGIWAGFLFVSTGIFSVLSFKTKSRCLIIALLVLEIVSFIMSMIVIGVELSWKKLVMGSSFYDSRSDSLPTHALGLLVMVCLSAANIMIFSAIGAVYSFILIYTIQNKPMPIVQPKQLNLNGKI